MNEPINNINRNWERAMLNKLNKTVSVGKEQNFTEEEKARGRENLGITDSGSPSQKVYNIPTSQITDPQEGDITIVPASWDTISPSSTVSGDSITFDTTSYTGRIKVATTQGSVSGSYVNADDQSVNVGSISENVFPAGTKSITLTATGGVDASAVTISEEVPSYAMEYINGSWVDRIDANQFITNVISTNPVGGFLPNEVYDLGELTGNVTFALAAPTDFTKPNPYHWTFETGSTPPTVSWPSNIIWTDGIAPAPTLAANKHYEITVRNGYATLLVFSLPTV